LRRGVEYWEDVNLEWRGEGGGLGLSGFWEGWGVGLIELLNLNNYICVVLYLDIM